MADVSPLNFTSLNKYLGRFEQKLNRVLEACNVMSDYDLRLKKIDGSNKFELLRFAKFIGVKQRGNSRKSKEKLNIFCHFEGSLDDEGRVTKYRTRVCYTLVKKNAQPDEICLVKGIRYDFNSASELLHPICHAQEDISTLKDEIGKDNFKIQNTEQIEHLEKNCLYAVKNARVPTAFLDFFSIVIMILADHCIKKDVPEQVSEFNKILKFVINDLPNIPLVTDLLLDNSTLKNTKIINLHSAHWYAARLNS